MLLPYNAVPIVGPLVQVRVSKFKISEVEEEKPPARTTNLADPVLRYPQAGPERFSKVSGSLVHVFDCMLNIQAKFVAAG